MMQKSMIYSFVICVCLLLFTVNLFAGPKDANTQVKEDFVTTLIISVFGTNFYENSVQLFNYILYKENVPEVSTLPPAQLYDAPQDPPKANVPPAGTLPPPIEG